MWIILTVELHLTYVFGGQGSAVPLWHNWKRKRQKCDHNASKWNRAYLSGNFSLRYLKYGGYTIKASQSMTNYFSEIYLQESYFLFGYHQFCWDRSMTWHYSLPSPLGMRCSLLLLQMSTPLVTSLRTFPQFRLLHSSTQSYSGDTWVWLLNFWLK